MADKKQIILGVGLDSTEVKQGTEEISRSVNKMAGDVARESIQAGKAVSKIGDEALSSAEDFSKAESKIIQSIQRRTAALEAAGKGARAYQEALISNRGLDPAKFDAYLSKLDAAEKATQRLGQTTANVGSGVSGQFSNNLRNASFQIQDFAVQVNGGVDATKALAMQLPQMLVGFGTAGAVVGVFAALLPNLITLMGGVGDGSKKLSDAIGDLDKAIGDVGSTVKTFDMDGLYEQFNNANKATQAAIVGQLEFQRVFLETSRLVASKKFGEEIGGLGSFGTLDKLAGAYASSGSEKLAKQLGVSLDVAKDLLPVLNGLKNGTEDVNNAFSRFGTSLLSGNAESRALASSMASLAKSERDAAAASSAISEAQEKMSKGHVTTKKELEAANKAQKDHNTELEKFQALMDKINGKDTGLDATYWKDLDALHNAYNKGRLNIEQYREAVGKLTMAQKFYVDQLKQQEQTEANRAKYLGNLEKETEELVKKAEAAEIENARIGMTSEQLEELNRKRYESQISILAEKAATIESIAGRNSEVEEIEKQIDALRRLQSAEVARPKLERQAKEWEKFTDQIGQSLTDALYRAFESGEGFGKSFAKTLENTLKATFAKLLINTAMTTGSNTLNAAINALVGSPTSGAGSTNYLGLANNAQSMYNLYGTAMGAYTAYTTGAGALPYTAGLANAYGAAGGDSLGAFIAMNPQWTSAAGGSAASGGAAAGSAGASTGAMSLGAAAGYMAIIAAVFQMLTTSKTRYLNTQIKGTLGPNGLTNGMIGDEYKATGNLLNAGGRELEWRPLTGDQATYDEFYLNMRYGNYRNNPEALQSVGYLGDNIDPYTLQRVPYTQAQIDDAFARYVADQDALSIRINRTGSGETVATELEQGAALKAAFEAIYKGAKDSLQKTADLFGDKSLGATLQNYVSEINIQTSGSIADAIGKYADSLIQGMSAAWLPTVESLRATTEVEGKKITETWAQTFQRLITEASAVKDVFSLVGESLASLYGNNTDKILAASDAFVKLFGSIDAMTGAVNAYYENFYTSAEKQARAWEQIGKQFDALNVSTPTTREQFRALVEAQDLSTAAGQRTFAALMGLQGAFASLVPVVQDVTKSLQADTDAAFNALSNAVDAQRDVLQAQIDAANEQVSSIKGLIQILDAQVNELTGNAAGKSDSALLSIDEAVRNAQAGYLPDAEELSSAIAAARAGIEAKPYSSAADQARDSLVLAGKLNSIREVSDVQLTVAERQLKAAEDQVKALDDMLEAARRQLNELRGINDGILSVESALKDFQQSFADELSRSLKDVFGQIIAQLKSGQTTVQIAGGQIKDAISKGGSQVKTDAINSIGTAAGVKDVWVSSAGALAIDGTIYGTNGSNITTSSAIANVNSALASGNANLVYESAKDYGLSGASLDALMGWTPGTTNTWAEANNLPKLSTGTNYVPNDMLALIHEGEAVIPKPYNPWAGVSADSTAEEVRSLRTQVSALTEIIRENTAQARRTANAVNGQPESPMLVETV